MSQNSLFRRNLIIIAILHVVLVAGLFFGGFFSSTPHETIVQIEGGEPEGGTQASNTPEPDDTPEQHTPAPTPRKSHDPATPLPPSEIMTSTPEPSATPVPKTPTPTPTPATPTPATPTPTPATPRPTATVTPKPATPKPSPSPTAKPKTPTPKPTVKKTATPGASAAKPSASPAPSKTPKATSGEGTQGTDSTPGHTATSGTGTGTGKTPGSGGHNPAGGHAGSTGSDQMNWYNAMLQDRFTSRWVQPPSLIQDGQNMSAFVKIRVEKDGTISSAELSKSSGNAVMDESVMLAAHSVTKIEPLPSTVEGGYYIVTIEFRLKPN